jgi:hypothetical protein
MINELAPRSTSHAAQRLTSYDPGWSDRQGQLVEGSQDP